ncbi:hypothetical protein [Paraclostridium dentum]|uniref:hypothetical protein n=1 Tax=Paraclostridium dentum TaxID=2662455 RepID=UPI0034640859
MKKFKTIEELNAYISEEFSCESIEDLLRDYKKMLNTLSKIINLLGDHLSNESTFTRG